MFQLEMIRSISAQNNRGEGSRGISWYLEPGHYVDIRGLSINPQRPFGLASLVGDIRQRSFEEIDRQQNAANAGG